MSNNKSKSQDEILKEIIKQSGHDFHLRVSDLLQKNGWEVKNSPHYSDPATNLNREIDIVAIKNYTTGGKYNTEIYLYIECKYIPNETVMWFTERNETKTYNLVTKNFRSTSMYTAYYASNLKHHYLINQKVAKLHQSNNNNQHFEKAINQVLNGFIYFDNLLDYNKKTLTLRYPIILIDSFDRLFGINLGDNSKKPSQISNNFQYELDYINNTVPEYYLIDIVCFDKLIEFIEVVEKNDLEILRNCLFEEWNEQRFNTRMSQKREIENRGR